MQPPTFRSGVERATIAQIEEKRKINNVVKSQKKNKSITAKPSLTIALVNHDLAPAVMVRGRREWFWRQDVYCY
jgi:hypothetical protein